MLEICNTQNEHVV